MRAPNLNPVDMESQEANELFTREYTRGWLRSLWSRLLGRPLTVECLLGDEREVQNATHYRGVVTVPVNAILGSEDRCEDFDATFKPLTQHAKSRWIGIAAAWLRGEEMPPVELIQVGEHYYVRDGHHRVSVARALGRTYIDAEVTVWE